MITYKDRMLKLNPEWVDKIYIGGVKGCPDQKGIKGTKLCQGKFRDAENCKRCWNRQVAKW